MPLGFRRMPGAVPVPRTPRGASRPESQLLAPGGGKGFAMAATEVTLVLAGAAGFALIIVATIMVIVGVRQEERAKTILGGHRPLTVCALLARWVLGAHFYLLPEERPVEGEGPEEEPPWFERSPPPQRPIGPRGR